MLPSLTPDASSHAFSQGTGIPIHHSGTPGRETARLQARWVSDPAELRCLRSAWSTLADRCLHANFSWEPNFLLPAFEHLGTTGDEVLIVESAGTGSTTARLFGLLPLSSQRLYKIPFRCRTSWSGQQCFDGTPLLDRELAVETLTTMLQALRQRGVHWLNLENFGAEPELEAVLNDAIQRSGVARFQRDQWKRAALCPAASLAEYETRFVSKSVRRNARRASRRLEEQGRLEFRTLRDDLDVDWIVREFLRLEASGWKGESGTALSCQPNTRDFFAAMIAESAAAGRLVVHTVMLDDRPVAMLCDLASSTRGAAYKTAFDDVYRQYSPGLLAELASIEEAHRRPGLECIDSCTSPDNQTINRIWGQQLAFQHVVLGLQPGPSSWLLQRLPTIQNCVHRLRAWRQQAGADATES